MMQERRNYPRASVDLPVTVRFPPQSASVKAKMIELSLGGTACFLYRVAPEINSEVEIEFNPAPDKIWHEIKLTGTVRHACELSAEHGATPDYRYVVGIEFKDIPAQAYAMLEDCISVLGMK